VFKKQWKLLSSGKRLVFVTALLQLVDKLAASLLCKHILLTSCEILRVYTRKNLTSCSTSANKPSTSCVRIACPKLSTSMEQLVKSYSNIVDILSDLL
jgi:hypothetical protein